MVASHVLARGRFQSVRRVEVVYLIHWMASMWYHWNPTFISLCRDYVWIAVLVMISAMAFTTSLGLLTGTCTLPMHESEHLFSDRGMAETNFNTA